MGNTLTKLGWGLFVAYTAIFTAGSVIISVYTTEAPHAWVDHTLFCTSKLHQLMHELDEKAGWHLGQLAIHHHTHHWQDWHANWQQRLSQIATHCQNPQDTHAHFIQLLQGLSETYTQSIDTLTHQTYAAHSYAQQTLKP